MENNQNNQNNQNKEEVTISKEQIEKFLATKEGQDFLQPKLDSFLATKEGQDFLQPKLDSFFSKGLSTWKENNLTKIVEDEIVKRKPEETPEQKRIRELEEKLNAQEKNAFLSNLKTKATKELNSKGLPSELTDFMLYDSEEVMRDSINNFENVFKAYVDKAVDTRLKGTGKTPNTGQKTGFNEKAMTKEKLLSMSLTESTEFYNQNPELFRKLMK